MNSLCMPTAKVIEDTIAPNGKRLISLQLRYQRFIHAEAKTHRIITKNSEEYEQIVLTQDESFMSDTSLSRNASSSRAIPVSKMIEQVRNEPAMPIHWGKNQPGMQAAVEHDAPVLLDEFVEYDNPSDAPLFTVERTSMSVQDAWREAAKRAADVAEAMSLAGYHKQVVNRILEPFQWINVVVTASEWDNFFELRAHPDAQPEIQALAIAMREAIDKSVPRLATENPDLTSSWHLPYITAEEHKQYPAAPLYLARLSVARCARVSFLNHDGTNPDPVKDMELYERLVGSKPLHASPAEHQAYAALSSQERSRNFVGFIQFREVVENGFEGWE